MKNHASAHYDIIIIGCGLVGGSLALALPETLSIAVIDAESPMQQQPGYLALNIHSCQILKNLGVWEDIVAQKITQTQAVTAINCIDISEYNQPLHQCLLHAEDIGAASLGYVTSTTAIRETLLLRLQAQKNITLYCPEQADTLEWPDEGLEKITVVLQKNQCITGKLAIIADGGRSTLRDKLGFHVDKKVMHGQAHHIVISRLKTHKAHHGLAFERFTPEGPIALLPINQDEYLLVWTMNAAQTPTFLSQSEASLMSALQAAYPHPDIAQWHEIGVRKSYPIVCSVVKNPIKTRLVLMGNAAHTVHPVGAQGFNLSLQDVLVLRTLVHEAAQNQRDIGSAQLLNAYMAQRKPDIDFVVYFTQFLLHIFSADALAKIRAMGFAWINHSAYCKQAILKNTTNPSLREKAAIKPLQYSNNKHYDIIILGNRLIGSTLACALDPRYRIAILDRVSTPPLSVDYQLRINAYNRASEVLLRTIGVWQHIPADRRFAFDKIMAKNEATELAFDAKSIGESHIGHFIENDLVTHYLHQQIKTLPHIDFIDDVSVLDIHTRPDSIDIIAKDTVYSAKLLAACDGGNSIARQLLGIDVDRRPYGQRCIVSNIFFEGDLNKTAWQRFLPMGPLGLLPLSSGVCSLAWSCDSAEASKLLALSDADFIIALNQATEGRLGLIARISARQSFPLVAQHATHYIAERTLLLGDAAHTIHPLGGLGANLGFQDVIAATTLLNDPHVSRHGRDIGRRYVLEKYETMRRRHNARVMASMTAFNALFHQTHPRLNPIGRLGLRLANTIAPIKNALFRQAMWMGTQNLVD